MMLFSENINVFNHSARTKQTDRQADRHKITVAKLHFCKIAFLTGLSGNF